MPDNPRERSQIHTSLGKLARRYVPPGLVEELGRYGEGAELDQCPVLSSIIAGTDDRVAQLVSAMCERLFAEPLGHIPFRHSYSGGMSVLQLAVAGRAELSLVAYSQDAAEIPQTLCFADTERIESVLVGSAQARIVRIVSEKDGIATFENEDHSLSEGDKIALTGTDEAKLLLALDCGPLVILRLSRSPARPVPSREYRLADGTLLHRASGSRSASRHLMFVETLGAMEREDAAPLLAEICRNGEAGQKDDEGLRWQALRHALVLNTQQGFAALEQISSDRSDPLHQDAEKLRQSLLRSHPELTRLSAALCPG